MASSKWVWFERQPKPADKKTFVYFVINKTQNISLGEVRWHGPWRQYVFFPKADTLYAQSCLRDIAEFLGSLKN